MTVKVEVKTKFRINQAIAKERLGAIRGLDHATEHLLGESTKVVPLEEATLLRSGVASVDNSALVGHVSFDTVYAVRQHEELTWKHDPGRQAKYLEEPYLRDNLLMQEIIAAQIRRALK